MKAAIWKKLTYAAATVIMLPLIGTASAATPPTPATIVLNSQRALSAGDCIGLGTQRSASRTSVTGIMPVLSNHCDYAVSISYCIDGNRAGLGACDAADKQQITRVLQSRETIRVDAPVSIVADNTVNWIACRSVPGVTSRLNSDGTHGQCTSVSHTMQASAQAVNPAR